MVIPAKLRYVTVNERRVAALIFQLLEDALDMRTQQLFHLQKALVLHSGEGGEMEGGVDQLLSQERKSAVRITTCPDAPTPPCGVLFPFVGRRVFTFTNPIQTSYAVATYNKRIVSTSPHPGACVRAILQLLVAIENCGAGV